jgi:hypothetical protein
MEFVRAVALAVLGLFVAFCLFFLIPDVLLSLGESLGKLIERFITWLMKHLSFERKWRL